MLDTLRRIGPQRFPEIDLTTQGTRWVTQEVPKKYADYHEEICDGWHLITMSTTEHRYMLLKAIATRLGLDCNVEIGDFETSASSRGARSASHKKDSKLVVVVPDGVKLRGTSVSDTFLLAVRKIGPALIRQKHLEWNGKPLVSATQQYRSQICVDNKYWVYVPNSFPNCVKLLRVMNAMLALNMQIITIDDLPIEERPKKGAPQTPQPIKNTPQPPKPSSETPEIKEASSLFDDTVFTDYFIANGELPLF